MREFLYVDDLADACVHLMNTYNDPQNIVNVGTGEDITIRQLAETISEVVGYNGHIMWDTSKPNGTMRKVMDVSRINSLGWKASTELHKGIEKAYHWFKEYHAIV
jgi:GDP-L-fucose synthase